MKDDSSRNTIIFLVCALVLFILYNQFILGPQQKAAEAARKAHPPVAAQTLAPGAPALNAPAAVTRDAALAASPRVLIATPSLKGSISLRGARLDDLFLTQYAQTTAKHSPPVEMLRPEGAQFPWFVDAGWVGQNVPGMPTPSTVWTLAQGSTLAPNQPIVLTYANGAGLTFTRKVEVDDHYMFTLTDTVANTGAVPVTLAPYGSVQRQGVPPDEGKSGVVHEGWIGYLDGRVRAFKYKDIKPDGAPQQFDSAAAWTGITHKYWLAAMIPNAADRVHVTFHDTKVAGLDDYEANYAGGAVSILPGHQVIAARHIFAGAKTVPLLQAYEKNLGIGHFDEAVDWGMFWFLTRPIFILVIDSYCLLAIGKKATRTATVSSRMATPKVPT